MEYEAARESGRDFGYETDLLRILERYVTDCDHKIAQCQRRLEEDNAQTIDKSIDQTAEITTKIEETMVKAEKLGEEGKVQESMALMTEVENLRKQKEAIQANAVLAAAPSLAAGGRGVPRGNNQQKLRVCDVCAAYLSITDTDRRLADHFAGRTHLGYRQIRDKYNELKQKLYGVPPSRGLPGAGEPPRGDSHGPDRRGDSHQDDRDRRGDSRDRRGDSHSHSHSHSDHHHDDRDRRGDSRDRRDRDDRGERDADRRRDRERRDRDRSRSPERRSR
eukprot:GAFH01003132.1.p2 GENE.GAFH01003132.1~~GAFH01003132.1.p2  ORF type:complete len:308 (+),score=40.05 GAFH01003132.1:96-926(+)